MLGILVRSKQSKSDTDDALTSLDQEDPKVSQPAGCVHKNEGMTVFCASATTVSPRYRLLWCLLYFVSYTKGQQTATPWLRTQGELPVSYHLGMCLWVEAMNIDKAKTWYQLHNHTAICSSSLFILCQKAHSTWTKLSESSREVKTQKKTWCVEVQYMQVHCGLGTK